MLSKEPKCVLWKRLGAEEVRKRVEGLSPEEELEYWRVRTEELRVNQQKTRERLAGKSILSALPSYKNLELSDESLSLPVRNTAVPEQKEQPISMGQGVRLHSISGPTEAVLPRLPDDVEAELAAMSSLLDETLWILARSTVSIRDQERFANLNQEAKIRSINHQEQMELDRLLGLYERTMLRKAQAASLLNKRGYDMSDPAILQEPT